MKIGALKEGFEGEARVAITPSSAGHLMKLGHEVFIESGAADGPGFRTTAIVPQALRCSPIPLI